MRRLATLALFTALTAHLLTPSNTAEAQGANAGGPEYEVLLEDGPFEVRAYAPMVQAVAKSGGSYFSAGNNGNRPFGQLFRYITGANEGAAGPEKIAMTSPVFVEPVEGAIGEDAEADWSMGFVLPRDYDFDSAPEPRSEAVAITQTLPQTVAVVRFSGRMSRALEAQKRSDLEAWIDARGLQAAGAPFMAMYDAPRVPGPQRRNEVHIRLTRASLDAAGINVPAG